ncbi:hypothetical protein HEP87_63740 [Streptomyces sp. S1D4-11]
MVLPRSASTPHRQPGAATGAHHHGDQETVLYVIGRAARYRWATSWRASPKPGPAAS